MKIGVLSDTHLDDLGQALPFLQALADTHFADVEMILHAGDLVNPDILLAFPDRVVHAVRGNMDLGAGHLPTRKIVEAGVFRIGLIHGWGAPETLEERVLREFSADRLDCVVFGHSHHPVCHRRDGILLFNPGSPTDRRWSPYHSVGLLEVGTRIEGRIIRLVD